MDERGRPRLMTTRKPAEQHLAQQGEAKRTGTFVDPLASRQLFGEFVKQSWWPSRRKGRESTEFRDEIVVRLHLLPTFEAVPLDQVTHLMVRDWIAEMSPRKAAATVAKAYQLLTSVLELAVKANVLTSNPARGVDNFPSVGSTEMRFCNAQEVAVLVATIPERYRAMVLVMAFRGAASKGGDSASSAPGPHQDPHHRRGGDLVGGAGEVGH